jgi:hypothetical protein
MIEFIATVFTPFNNVDNSLLQSPEFTSITNDPWLKNIVDNMSLFEYLKGE